MTDKDILDEMIKSEALIPLEGSEHKPRVTLTEVQAPDSMVVISQMPSDSLVIKIGSFSLPNNIFCGNNQECRCADYVIISPQKKCVVYIELKRTNANKSDFVSQLKGAKCFIKYCEEIGKEFWEKQDFLHDDYKHWFVGIGHSNIKKSKTRETRFTQNSNTHSSPKDFLKIDWAKNLIFEHLIG